MHYASISLTVVVVVDVVIYKINRQACCVFIHCDICIFKNKIKRYSFPKCYTRRVSFRDGAIVATPPNC